MNENIKLHNHNDVMFITYYNSEKLYWVAMGVINGAKQRIYGYSRSQVAEAMRQDIAHFYNPAAIGS